MKASKNQGTGIVLRLNVVILEEATCNKYK